MSSQDADRSDVNSTPVTESARTPSAPHLGSLRFSGPAAAQRPSQLLASSASQDPAPTQEVEDPCEQRAEGDFPPERALDEQIGELEAWAQANVDAERVDTLRFWGMRVLAFLGAGAAGAAAATQHDEVAVSAALFASLAIVVDAAWPSTSDRMARRRAIRDLRELQHNLKLKWDKVRLAHPNANAPKRIAHALVLLDQIQAKREDVGRYLGDASPGVGRRLGQGDPSSR